MKFFEYEIILHLVDGERFILTRRASCIGDALSSIGKDIQGKKMLKLDKYIINLSQVSYAEIRNFVRRDRDEIDRRRIKETT